MRLVQLIKYDVKADNRGLMGNHREGAPIGV